MNPFMKTFACPKCGKDLLLDDVNVAQDMALCRACGYSGAFLNTASVPQLTDEEMARPPKRVSLRREFGDALSIECRPNRAALWFLIPFTALWSGGSMIGIYGTQIWSGNYDVKQSLFGLPFLFGTVVLLTIILHLVFGKTTVTLTKGRVRIFTGLFGAGRTRELECGKETTVALAPSGYRVNDVVQPEIVLSSEGRELRFGAMALSSEAKKYVAAVLRRAACGG